ncbi:hypothetical protein, partial [Moraxella sp.]|uniref:hypothetical protein n=1 Tax=Moraxella sp. TaxID=479 RepID=UPI00262A773F
QVQLEWRAWQAGIDELVKTGDGLPLGRLKDGQWDADYIPPVMSLATHHILWQQASEVMNQVSILANRDSRVAELSLVLRQTDLAIITPLAFWQNHCQCLVALKAHPKLANDLDYKDSVSKLLSATFSLSMIFDGLEPLSFAWKRVEECLDKKEKPIRRCVSLGWYATSMVTMAGLLGVGFVYQSDQSDKSMNELKAAFENQLAALDNKADDLSEQITKKADDLSEQLTKVDNKHIQKADDLSEQLTKVDNKHIQKADDLSE